MQRVASIDADQAYATLAVDAQPGSAFGIELRVCSLPALRLMKHAAGGPQDLQDLDDLEIAQPENR